MDLLQHLVYVDGVRLPSSSLPLLLAGPRGLRLRGGLLSTLTCRLWRHLLSSETGNLTAGPTVFDCFICPAIVVERLVVT